MESKKSQSSKIAIEKAPTESKTAQVPGKLASIVKAQSTVSQNEKIPVEDKKQNLNENYLKDASLKPSEVEVKPGPSKLMQNCLLETLPCLKVKSIEKRENTQCKQIETFLQRYPLNKLEVGIWKKLFATIFRNLTVNDIKSCRYVCKLWDQNLIQLLNELTCFNFNCENDPELVESPSSMVLKPWKLFVPAKGDRFYEYLEESKTRLRYWSMFKIRSASSADIKYIIDSEGSNLLFRDSVRSITTLEISSCTLEFSLLFRLLDCFTSLSKYIDTQNIYHEPVPIYTQVLQGLTGGSTSPDTHSTEIDQEFISRFKKYKISPKALRIEDSGQGTSTSLLIYILPEVLVKNCVSEIDIVAGSECVQHGELTQCQRESRYFWVAVGELLLHCKSTLKKLRVNCTKDNSPMDSFELFLNSCTNYLSSATADDLTSMTILSLDFKFFWISSALFPNLLIPFIKRCSNLKYLKISSIILKSKYENRLEMLYPLQPACHYNLGLHLSDLEISDTPIPEMISLAESELYEEVARSIHFSVQSPETMELRKFLKVNGKSIYKNVASLSLTIMNQNFNNLSTALLPTKFPALRNITIIDGPVLKYTGRHLISPENLFKHMSSLKLENDDIQLIIASYPLLQNLHLQMNMENVTDAGTTGLVQATVNRLINHRDMMIHDPECEIYGKSFGDLEYLESLALKGLGAQITEVTAFFGFKEMKKLKNLFLYGKQRIGKDGKKFLLKSFPATEGCNVSIIE